MSIQLSKSLTRAYGFISTKSHISLWSLHRLFSILENHDYLTANSLSLMTLIAEHFHSTIHVTRNTSANESITVRQSIYEDKGRST